MSSEIEWLNQEWKRFTETETGQRALVSPIMSLSDVSKLFAAFCLKRLKMELTVEEEMTGGQ
jgi:hypothetical protein